MPQYCKIGVIIQRAGLASRATSESDIETCDLNAFGEQLSSATVQTDIGPRDRG
jgi:hypothetical protein